MNAKYLKSRNIPLYEKNKMQFKKKDALRKIIDNEELRRIRRDNVQRIEEMAFNTDNSYNEDYETSDKWVETGNYKLWITHKRNDNQEYLFQRPLANKKNATGNNIVVLLDVKEEPYDDWRHRQLEILDKLNQKNTMEDEKYAKKYKMSKM